MRRWVIAGIGSVVVTASVGSVIAFANGDAEGGVVGRQADQAIQAALDATGGGAANGVERDSEDEAYWEVEIRKPGGDVVDVRLQRDYSVVVIEADSEAADTRDAGS